MPLEPTMREGREQVFYVHVPSCGGTTFWSVLRSVYGAKNVVRCVKNKATLARYNVIEDVRARYADKDAIGGHLHYAPALMKCPERRMITFLRDPIDRAVSVYCRKVRNGDWAPSAHRGRRDIVDFWQTADRHAELACHLAPIGSGEIVGGLMRGVPKTTAAEITGVLAEGFACFGILEHFNRSLFLIGETLGWKTVPTYDRRNIAGDRPATISSKTREELSDLLSLDRQVYESALELFERRWRATRAAMNSSALDTYERELQMRQHNLIEWNGGRNPYGKFSGRPHKSLGT